MPLAKKQKISTLTAKKHIPIYAFLELTRKCNLNCRHCYIVKEKRPELSSGAAKLIINQLADSGSLILNLSGGEVFTRKDFFDIAEYARSKKFAIKIFTNGTLIDADTASRIKALKPLRVEVTLYSLNGPIHDSITRIKGSWGLTMSGIKNLAKTKVPIRIKCPLTKLNVGSYKGVLNFSKKINAKYQFDPTITPKLNGSTQPATLRINAEQLYGIFSDPELDEKSFNSKAFAEENFICSAGRNSCAISAYGDVLPCIIWPESLGNLKEKKFSEIWKNSHKLKTIRSIKMCDLARCSRCGAKKWCSRCPGLGFLEKGNLREPSDRNCQIALIKKDIAISKSSRKC